MKQITRYILALAAVLLFTSEVMANETATVIKKIDGAAAGTTDPGTVAYENNGTITVTPNNGYYLTAADLTVVKTLDSQHADARRRSPAINNTVSVTATDASADPSKVTTYTFSVTDTNYDYEITANFHSRTNIAGATVTVGTYTYNGSAITPTLTVTYGNVPLASSNYAISYQKNDNGTLTDVTEMKDAGAYKIVLTGKREYMGSKSIDFSVGQKSISNVTASVSGTYTYIGSAITPTLTVTDGNVSITSNDYTVSYQKIVNGTPTDVTEMKDAGAYKIVLTGKSNYKDTKSIDFSVGQKSISNVTASVSGTYTYTGSAITPTLTVSDGNVSITSNDYTVSYQKNDTGTLASVTEMKDAGDYKIVLTGKGNYKDTKSIDFTINRAASTVTPPTAKTLTYTGKAQELVTAGSATGGTLVYSLDDATYSTAIPTGTDAAAYKVYYKVNGNSNYNGIVAATVDVTINPAAITSVTLDQTELMYNPGVAQSVKVTSVKAGTLDVSLNDCDVNGLSATDVGSHTVTVTAKAGTNFTGSATAVFNIIERNITTALVGFAPGQTWATYYNATESFNLPADITAYIVTAISNNSVTLSRISTIPMGTPVLLEKASSTAAASMSTAGNLLVGVAAATDISTLTTVGAKPYVLYNSNFIKATSGTVPAGRCYLPVPNGAAARSLSIISNDDATGINDVQIAVPSDVVWYDMQGRRINPPTKNGLYVKNGQKVVVNNK